MRIASSSTSVKRKDVGRPRSLAPGLICSNIVPLAALMVGLDGFFGGGMSGVGWNRRSSSRGGSGP